MSIAARRKQLANPRPSFRFNKPLSELHLIPGNKTELKKRPIFLVVSALIGLLLALIVVPLLINTQLAILSYQIHADEVEINQLNEENQTLRTKVINQSSPERVREIAEKNGLIPAGETGYITLSDQTMQGGEPAVPPPPDEPLPLPKPQDKALVTNDKPAAEPNGETATR